MPEFNGFWAYARTVDIVPPGDNPPGLSVWSRLRRTGRGSPRSSTIARQPGVNRVVFPNRFIREGFEEIPVPCRGVGRQPLPRRSLTEMDVESVKLRCW